MCGIAGIIQSEKKGTVDEGILRRMNSRLVHRGPDDEGYWVRGNVGLAMRRLSIIDLEGGRQPVSNEEANVWTVFNGEIYNFENLRAELIEKGHRFKSRSDTEVIVHLYEEKGEDFVRDLRGMFALALWDGRAKKLLLYRDRTGIKPLHYWFRNGTLLFASEIKSLLEHPGVRQEISLPALSDYLSFLYIPEPRTIYREISKLPAGHFLRYQNEAIKIQSYWDFSYPENSLKSEEEWAEALRDALQESVRMHLVSDVPVGAFLSGGMDSSTVVACMSRAARGKVKTYSIGFKDPQFNELPFAAEAARHFGTDHHEQIVEVDAFELLPKIIAGFDEPFADSSALPTYLVSEFARREVKVALSGDGGDELFAGYLWTQKEAWLENYRRLPFSLRKGIERLILQKNFKPLRERGTWGLIQRFVYDAGLAPWQSFARRAACFQPWMKQDLLEPWVQEETAAASSLETFHSFYEKSPAESVLNRLLYLDSKIYLPDDLLTKVDRMSMLHSLEVRVPFLDHKLIELANSIPFSLKLKGRTTKAILKKAVADWLPPGILKQRKQGFSVPLGNWFRGKLGDLSRKVLLGEKSLSRKFFRREYIARLLAEHEKGSQRFGAQLYTLLVFELWSRMMQESKSRPAEPARLKDLVSA